MKHLKRIFENRINFSDLSGGEVIKEIDWKKAQNLSELKKLELEDWEISEIKSKRDKFNLKYPILSETELDSSIKYKTEDEILKIEKFWDDWFLISYFTSGGEIEKYWILDTLDFFSEWLKRFNQQLTESYKITDFMDGVSLYTLVSQPEFFEVYFKNPYPEKITEEDKNMLLTIFGDYIHNHKNQNRIMRSELDYRTDSYDEFKACMNIYLWGLTKFEITKLRDDYWLLFFYSIKKTHFVFLDTIEGLELYLEKEDPMKYD